MPQLSIIQQAPVTQPEALQKFEETNNVQLPASLKAFLIEKNPIVVEEIIFKHHNREFWIAIFFPFDNTYEVSFQFVYERLKDFLQNKYVAFANDPGGWLFVISIQEEDYGKIYFCRMDEELEDAVTLLADDLDSFINGLEKEPLP